MSYRRAIEQLRPVRYPKENIQEKVQSFLTEASASTKFKQTREFFSCVKTMHFIYINKIILTKRVTNPRRLRRRRKKRIQKSLKQKKRIAVKKELSQVVLLELEQDQLHQKVKIDFGPSLPQEQQALQLVLRLMVVKILS